MQILDLMKDSIIELDSEFANEIGFTSDIFDGWLWKVENYICISFIVSNQKRQANVTNLFNAILNKGFDIKVPTPTNMMKAILRKKEFIEIEEYDFDRQSVAVWLKYAETSIDALSPNITKEGEQYYE